MVSSRTLNPHPLGARASEDTCKEKGSLDNGTTVIQSQPQCAITQGLQALHVKAESTNLSKASLHEMAGHCLAKACTEVEGMLSVLV